MLEAESTIDFNSSDSVDKTPGFGVASLDDTLRPLPGEPQIAVKLRNRISGDMAVGTLIHFMALSQVMWWRSTQW